ncbi:hypothetical protein Mevan_1535 [Methanococcus vannielii SB]|uniref:Uncharacterized protein n=1 Tax=Methanococcus vannielii (strain ATCC 35089 / DSM 1224 / JCM 13029 / OCM 148 / SB) TaxID=406327 RepID=A6USF6_METVS|nr:hypothetical protein Mevan_1535 [Methanococcus vannielii SB]
MYIRWSKLDIEIYKYIGDPYYITTSSKWISKVLNSEKLDNTKIEEIIGIKKLINKINE